MGLKAVDGMLPLPAGATKILETLEVPAEVRADDATAHGAQGVLQIWVNLDLIAEARGKIIITSPIWI